MNNLLKLLMTVSSATMLSRILGFIRDTILAKIFGVGIMTDAFFIAFKLPNLLRRIFAEGAFYQVFLPIFSEYQHLLNTKQLRLFIAHVLGALVMFLILIIVIVFLIAPKIVMIIAPGLNMYTEKFEITVAMFRIMFFYILLISIASLMGAVLNAWNFFLVPAFSSIFLNISMIGTMLLTEYFYFSPPIMGLAWSVIIGGILQCLYHTPFLKKINMLVFPKVNFYDKRIYQIFCAMGPILIVMFVNQISLIINTIFASFLVDGSFSWMYFADRLVELPIGVFGVALNTILFPYLSRCVSTKNNYYYCNLMNWGIRLCCVFGFPSAIILGVLSKPLVITLFQYGKFSEFDVLMTQYSIIAYAIGLPGLILSKILTSGFYAYRDVKTPTQIMMITIFFTQLMNVTFIHSLQHVVFSLSISLGSWLNAGLLYWQLKKKFLLFRCPFGWRIFVYQLMVAIFLMCAVCLASLMLVIDWAEGSIFFRLFRMMGVLILCVGVYILILWMLGMRVKDFFVFNKNFF